MYKDSSVATDGILTFPRSMDCTGIERNSLGGLEEEVIEVYIPSNITYIAPGAFDHLHLLMFIEVAEDNPAYYSEVMEFCMRQVERSLHILAEGRLCLLQRIPGNIII